MAIIKWRRQICGYAEIVQWVSMPAAQNGGYVLLSNQEKLLNIKYFSIGILNV